MPRNLRMFLVGFFLSISFGWGLSAFQNDLENFFYAQISQPIQEIASVKIQTEEPELDIEAKSAMSLKINKFGRKKTLFKKETDLVLPIASLSKLMTALIVLENPEDYNFSKGVVVSERAANQENVHNYGNLKVKESFRVGTLLELMLIYSSNDAAWALSEVIGMEDFVEKMNLKSKELNLENTYFVNPTGLDPKKVPLDITDLDDINHSTPKELLELAQYILENHPLIFKISTQKGPYLTKNGVSDLSLDGNNQIIGGKTGYTNTAGGCMLFAFKNEKETIFLNVILGTPSLQNRINEMQKLIDWLNN